MLKAKYLAATATMCQQMLTTLLEQTQAILDARFADQPDEMRCVYLANVKAGVANVGEALVDLARRAETAGNLWGIYEGFDASLEAVQKQQQDLARVLYAEDEAR
jgi:hypothetical protein